MVDVSSAGIHLTDCRQCRFTCHDNCPYANDEDQQHCFAMGDAGYCTQCPGKCHWSEHYDQKYRWELMVCTWKETVEDVKEKFLEGITRKIPVQTLIDKLKTQRDLMTGEMEKPMETSNQCLSLSIPEYIAVLVAVLVAVLIAVLVEGDEAEVKPGLDTRIHNMGEIRHKY